MTTSVRLGVLPDIPTVGDFVSDYEASSVQGIGIPKITPAEIIDRLHAGLAAALADPKVKARFTELGIDALALAPADFGKLVADETDKWAKVIKFAGIKPQ